MDQPENRLGVVLARVAERAAPVEARLQNPAQLRAPRTRRFTVLAAAASALVVAGVAIGVGMAVTRAGSTTDPTGPVVGDSDGQHPRWDLRRTDPPAPTLRSLPGGGKSDPPVPYTINPTESGAGDPTLVTATGRVLFTDPRDRSVDLLGTRTQGTYVGLNRADDGPEVSSTRYELVTTWTGFDHTRTPIYSAASPIAAAVSPGGTMLAVLTRDALRVVDVAHGEVLATSPGSFADDPATPTGLFWASDQALLVDLPAGRVEVRSAPFTGAVQELVLPRTRPLLPVRGGLLAVDDDSGCLRRIDDDGRVAAANCAGWRSGGPASPDGRYVPLRWRDPTGVERSGVLDVTRGQVRTWPADGVAMYWLGPTTAVLTEPVMSDGGPVVARCDLSTGRCLRITDLPSDPDHHIAWIGR